MSVNTPRGSDAITSSAMRREPLLSAPQEQQQEHHKTLTMDAFSGRVPTLIGLTLAAAWLAFGIICFHELLDLTWAAAFYFAVTTSMTVGYGDIDGWNPMSRNTTTANDGTPYVPEEGAIMFTIFYILGGMVVVGTAMGMFVSKVLEGNSDTGCRAKYPLAISAALCALTLLIGASLSAEINDYDFLHGLYWAVVTASTTGYGSGGPQTDGARLFAALYMLVSVACMGNFVGELSARPLRAHRAKLEKRVMSQYGGSLEAHELAELLSSEQLKALGLRRPAGGGHEQGVSRDAFTLLMLVRAEKLTPADLRMAQKAFDELDADGSGVLDVDDLSHPSPSSPAIAPVP